MPYIYLCLWTVWLLPSCTEYDASVVSNEETGLLRFSVSPVQADSRVSYQNTRSVFDDNDAIGCIITVNGAYAANSKWHYNGSTGMLIFDGIWGNKTIEWQTTWSLISYNDEDNTLLDRATSDENENKSDGFIKLEQEGIYNFYFYYPYVDNTLLQEDIKQSNGNYKSLIYPNVLCANYDSQDYNAYTQYYPVGEAKKQGQSGESWNQSFTSYTWTSYPCFVNHTQTAKTQINNSDFLWVKQEGLNQSSNQSINLTFLKKTATIEIDSDIRLSDVYLQANANQRLRRGKSINLQTGELDDYTYSTEWGASIQQENVYFTATEQLLPYDNLSNAGTNFRVVFPAQDAFPCSLHFTLNNVPREVDLSTNISSLKEGFLYIIHINQAGETTLEIVDWENEHFEILHPEDAQSPQS